MINKVDIDTKIGDFHLKINLLLSKGINCLFGPSGSGKTSIVNCMAGLIKPKSALIKINNRTLNDTKNKFFLPIHKRRIGYVFQDSRLFPHLNVKQNLMYGHNIRKYNKKNFIFNDIVELLKLDNVLLRYPYNLSGGEKQRVSIGRAILSQPDILIMDEPLASLDQKRKNELLMYIIKINKKYKIPIVYVSHSLFEIFLLGKNINFINNGNLAFSGNKEQSLLHYNSSLENSFEDSYIKGRISKIRNKDNLSELNIGKNKLLIFTNSLKLNSHVLVKIRSSNVIISKNKPANLSSLNFIKVKIKKITIEKYLVLLILEFNNNTIKAHITKKSYRLMKIKNEEFCYALIKAININDFLEISLF